MTTLELREKFGLTERQARFVEFYASTGNGVQSAILAGYSETGAAEEAYRQLKRANIRSALSFLGKKVTKDIYANVGELKHFLAQVMRGQVKTTIVTKQGEPIDVDPAVKDRVRATELLLKTQGQLVDRHEYSGPDGAPLKHEVSAGPSGPEWQAFYEALSPEQKDQYYKLYKCKPIP